MASELQRVPVLIVGGGLAGLAASVFLTRHGVRSVLVERRPGVRPPGGGSGIDQRTMEICRALGLEEEIRGTVRRGASPGPGWWPDLCPCDVHEGDRHALEPVLLEAARRPGAVIRFGAELVSIATDSAGADAALFDRATGRTDVVRADYVIAAEGTGGRVAASLLVRPPGRTAAPENEARYAGEPISAPRRAGTRRYLSGTAETFRIGRVFLVGDSARWWPGADALGAGLAVQEAHNLAWKLAGVIQGWAGSGLLDSYEAERRPVALELEKRWVPGSARMPSDEAEDQVLTLGQQYPAGALVGNRPDSVFEDRFSVRARPGTRAPHLWLERAGSRLSSHDLFDGSFVLLAGSDGAEWTAAARRVARRTSVPLRAYRLGRGPAETELKDLDGWGSARYPIGDGGAVLIRPDGYVGWLTETAPASPELALAGVLGELLR
ncbi:FAD-dependent monooxygenase [Amycolatopsis halotolerans]|uniref:FAD-dependent monooxygenase n=1 Tax=Amycolatopsis halotolerans TaxID=330083 RepID=A0ABV7Q804_9PSEU